MRTRTLTLKVLIITILTLSIHLQNFAQRENLRERIKTQRIAFFTEKLNLSQEEAEKFWPVYNDYSNRKDRINSETRNLRQFLNRNTDNMSDEEIQESMDKYVKLEEEDHQLFVDYHSKFLEILPARKVMNLYIAEDQFKQFLLQQLRERGGAQGKRRR